ncbi:MAG: hypothetical protein KF734_12890 [Saprospiraceae bacterium]|nr:hypothetical protein [Saprospiraceae bacterium]
MPQFFQPLEPSCFSQPCPAIRQLEVGRLCRPVQGFDRDVEYIRSFGMGCAPFFQTAHDVGLEMVYQHFQRTVVFRAEGRQAMFRVVVESK